MIKKKSKRIRDRMIRRKMEERRAEAQRKKRRREIKEHASKIQKLLLAGASLAPARYQEQRVGVSRTHYVYRLPAENGFLRAHQFVKRKNPPPEDDYLDIEMDKCTDYFRLVQHPIYVDFNDSSLYGPGKVREGYSYKVKSSEIDCAEKKVKKDSKKILESSYIGKIFDCIEVNESLKREVSVLLVENAKLLGKLKNEK